MASTVNLPQWVQIAAALGVGGVIKAGFDWLIATRKTKAKEPADLLRALGELSDTLSDGSQMLVKGFIDELTWLRSQIVSLRSAVEKCETSHDGCRAEVQKLAERLDKSERDRAALIAETERLMREHPAADYGPEALRGVVPPKP